MKLILFLAFTILTICFFSCKTPFTGIDNPVFMHNIKSESEVEDFFTSDEIIGNLPRGRHIYTYSSVYCETDTIIEFSINKNGLYDGVAKLWQIPSCAYFPHDSTVHKGNKYLDEIHIYKNGKLVCETQFHFWTDSIWYIVEHIKPNIKKGGHWTRMRSWDENGNLNFENSIWNIGGKGEVPVMKEYGINGLPNYETLEYSDSLIRHIYYDSGELLYAVNIDRKGYDNVKFIYYYKNGLIKAKGFCSTNLDDRILYDKDTHPQSGKWVYYDINGEEMGTIKYGNEKILEREVREGSIIPFNN